MRDDIAKRLHANIISILMLDVVLSFKGQLKYGTSLGMNWFLTKQFNNLDQSLKKIIK